MEKKDNFLYAKIRDALIAEIDSGRLKYGDRIPTEHEVMEKWNVSRITATHALRAMAEAGYITRVRHSGSFVSKRSEADETSFFADRGTCHIALINSYISALGTSSIFSKLMQQAFDHQILVSVFVSENDASRERKILEMLENASIDAVVSVPVNTFRNVDLYQRLRSKGIPVLFLDWHIPYYNIPCITFAHEQAAHRMTTFLIENGFTDIGFAFSSEYITTEVAQMRGYIRAMDEAKLPMHEAHFFRLGRPEDPICDYHYVYPDQPLREQFLQLKEQSSLPQAIVCANDGWAIHIIDVAESVGLRVPQDLSVTGFEDSEEIRDTRPALTTSHQDYTSFAKKVVTTLNRMLNGEQIESPILCDTELIVRDSVLLPQPAPSPDANA